ncbi:MAG: bifunctional 23S rRNA (guanine(2069)-N(7))-methyltransferase RlmK/23S rRNA (guanine(2445)-N(2))-methyltransferase RlmL [Myxococcota bacterium]
MWSGLIDDAQARRQQGMLRVKERGVNIFGFDADARVVTMARENARLAGVDDWLRFEPCDVARVTPPKDTAKGLVLTNAPYGERLGTIPELIPTYRQLGESLRSNFGGWQAAVLTSDLELGKELGLRAKRRNSLYNGPLACSLLHFQLYERSHQSESPTEVVSEGARMFENRLRKNAKKLSKWAQQNGVHCYRLYDADLPEYAVAIDLYEDRVHVQEYQAPKEIDERTTRRRLADVLSRVPVVLNVPHQQVFLKQRKRQKGKEQYTRQADERQFFVAREGGHRFRVNLTDYLDTGLFLDHRPTRALLQTLAPKRRFLNLFAYTATASVYAIKGGATSSLCVDASNTYCRWARQNFELNGIRGDAHGILRQDCLEYLSTSRDKFDLIFLDPPTFSNSRWRGTHFEVQRDHVSLLESTLELLSPKGILIFSCNYRRFKLDEEALPGLQIEDITQKTIPVDFARSQRIHRCWRIARA